MLATIINIIKQLCGLFRIDYKICLPFILCNKGSNKNVELPPKKVFNEIFRTVTISQIDNSIQISFESGKLEKKDSLDSLFAIKDLLFAKGIDTSSIPEYSLFSIQQDEEVLYSFNSTNGHLINIAFKYDHLKVDIKKNCA
jgi:hypothetical protein